MLYQRLTATNDVNGNPRRLIVFYDADGGNLVRIADEGYAGSGRTRIVAELAEMGLDPLTRTTELSSVEITTAEYRRLLRAHALR